MSEVGYCYLDRVSGLDSNDGLTWVTAKQTYAGCLAMIDDYGTLTILASLNGIQENFAHSTGKMVRVIGNPGGFLSQGLSSYITTGSVANASPIFTIDGSQELSVLGLCLVLTVAGKTFLSITNGTGSSFCFGVVANNVVLLAGANQIAIDIYDCISNLEITDNYFLSLGVVTGSHYVQSAFTQQAPSPVIFRQCYFLFYEDGYPASCLKEADIHKVAPGCVDNVQYYNCAWIRVNLDGTWTAMTARDTYPSTALRKDPNPMVDVDFRSITQLRQLETRMVVDASEVAKQADLSTLLGRVPSEVAQKTHLVNGAGNITPPTDKGIWNSLGNGGALAQPGDILVDPATDKINGSLLDASVAATAKPSDILVDPATDKIDGSKIDAAVATRATPADILATPANKLEGSYLDAQISLTALEAGGNLATVLGRVTAEVAPKSTAVSNADLTPTRSAKLDNLDTTIGSRATPADVTSAQSALTAILTKIQNFLKKTRRIGS